MKSLTTYVILILVSALLFGCSADNAAEQAPTGTNMPVNITQTPAQPTQTNALSPTATSTSAPLRTPNPNGNDLTIEENETTGKINLEPLTFYPVHGTQQDILERHAEEKEEPYSFSTIYSATGGEHNYEAFMDADNEGGMTVSVKQDGETIFQVDVEDGSLISPLQGLWVEDGHWVLEIAYVTIKNENNVINTEVVGQVYRDGVYLNEQYGYEEIFGYQLLNDKPFYFYKKDGQIHLSYDGETLPLQYDEVPHYQCCSGAAMNPVATPNWVGFWGLRDEVWYYTEIGQY